MDKVKKILWYVIVSAIVLVMFALVSTKVFAHGDGKCLTDADGNVRLDNGSWVKIIDHLSGDDLDGFVHGHRDQYYDRHGNPTGQAKGFFNRDFDDADGDSYADCPPVRTTAGATHPIPRPSTPTTPDRTTTEGSHPSTPTPTQNLDEVKEQAPTIPDEIKAEVLDVEPIEVTDEREWYDYVFHSSWNFVTFPVLPNGVETLEDFYPHLYNNPILVVYVGGCWLVYQGEGETGMIPLTPNMGVAVYAEQAFSVTIFGSRVKASELDLMPGGNFVNVPSDYKLPSDFLGEAIAVLRELEGKLYLIGRAGDSGNEPFGEGESVFLIVSGTAQAPMAYRASTLATSWGAMKQ